MQQLLAQATPQGVETSVVVEDGAPALRVALDPALRTGALGIDFGDQPTFLLLPGDLATGVVTVDLCARLLPDAPDYARGFIGLAYRVQRGSFEGLYLRPTNGRALSPPPPRDVRAVQYFAWPDWTYDRLRETDPGRYEAGADIAPDRWHRLSLEIGTNSLRALVDGTQVLSVNRTLGPASTGQMGLWVDIGTEGFFRTPRIVAG